MVENRPKDNDGSDRSDGVCDVPRPAARLRSMGLRLGELWTDIKAILHYPVLCAIETVDVAIVIPLCIVAGMMWSPLASLGLLLLTQIPLEIKIVQLIKEEEAKSKRTTEWTQKKPIPDLVQEWEEMQHRK